MVEVLIVEGDLLEQPVEAIVNAWNRNIIPWWLLLPHGVSGAIKKRGGLEPFQQVGRFGPIPLGEARVTGAGKLPFKCIIHVAAINMLWTATEESIQKSVRNAMAAAEQSDITSVGFPILGAGAGGMNEARAEAAMLQAFRDIDSSMRVHLVRYRG